jgi:hypothetical protein
MEFHSIIRLKKSLGLSIVLLTFGCVSSAQVTPQPTQSPTVRPAASPAQADLLPVSLSPDKLEFGEHDIGTTSYSQVVTLKNNGAVVLLLDVVISLNDVEFALSRPLPPVTLPAGAECPITIKFTPIDAEVRNGQLRVNYRPIDNSAPASNQTIPLAGKGAIPKLRLSQQTLDFGQQVIGSTSLVRTLILTAGQEAVGGLVATTTGDFTVTPVTCEQLQPSASCSLSVTFVPKRSGQTIGSLTIFNNKTAAKVVPLTAEGLESCNLSPTFWSRDEFYFLLPVLLMVLAYLVALVFVRWNMIARPTRNLLLAEIGAVQQRIAIVNDPTNPPPGLEHVSGLLERAANLVTDANASGWLDKLFWTRGQELAAWGYVHEAEEQLVFFLPPQTVRAELERVEGDLREEATPTAIGLADRIHEALVAPPPLPLKDPAREALEDVLRFLQPPGANVASDVRKAFAPETILTVIQWRDLAKSVLEFLAPQGSSIADRINHVLDSSTATVEQLKPLLQEAAKLLESDRLKLAARLAQAYQAETETPPKPLSADEWKLILQNVHDYLTPHASLVERIKDALAAKPDLPLDRWRALHSEALGYLYNRSDTTFAQLVSWQNKTVWLVGCSLLLIIALAATLQHGILFLVGATGGLMSRLARSLSRDDVPTDYGASWSTLFLSPLIGALAGWSGILLVIVGVEFNILGSALKFDWCNTFNPVMLGLALLLGTSERFFDGILDQLNRKIGSTAPTSSPAPAAPPLAIVTPGGLAEGKVDQSYSQALAASGGTPPYTWKLVTGSLPAGLNLDASGKISGNPTAAGTVKFTLQVADAGGKMLSLEFTIVVT